MSGQLCNTCGKWIPSQYVSCQCCNTMNTSYSEESDDPFHEIKQEIKMAHGKVVCKTCSVIISQCKCIEGHKNVSYGVCANCADAHPSVDSDKIKKVHQDIGESKSAGDKANIIKNNAGVIVD